LEKQLGRKPISRLSDLSSDPKIFLEQLKELLKNNPQLREPARDPFKDPNLLGRNFDPSKWPFPTQYFKPTQGQRQPTLPDGTCPAPPPGPGGEIFPPAKTDADGYCPAPNRDQPDAPGGLVIIPKEGGVPILVPGAMGTPVPSNPQQTEKRPDLAKAAATLGITEQKLREALGPPPPNLQTAAQKLGITFEKLKAALDQSMPA
jgi:hypothetical protein